MAVFIQDNTIKNSKAKLHEIRQKEDDQYMTHMKTK